MDAKKKITPAYNIVLFVIWFIFQVTVTLLSYKNEPDMLIDVLFDYNVFMGVGLMLVIFTMGAILSVWLIMSFWERFISKIFNVRQITANEALSIVLVLSILTVS
jgi:ribose/xylose/arabinose/galactoside ABC-type transport system permease subunit